ncbi:histidine phosphatase family protein [Epibacterium ulvae]|uniref:histidine phosphatase family protein n=1 Tax=Epibacterium ulvae TaxID=1156985 RepID=UPI0024936FFF|nr:histidine phosphatase family protein [Epibacterium ulvae]
MRSFPTIWFLRHGETEWNAERRIQGQLESQLTERGLLHAEAQKSILSSILADDPACYASPLGRAQTTAEIALDGGSFHTDERLAEAQAGRFQGMTLPEVERDYPEIYAANPRHLDLFCAAPDGEGWQSLYDRTFDFLTELERPSVIIAHGLLGQVVRGILCGLTRDEMARLPNEQGCVYVLKAGAETVLRR